MTGKAKQASEPVFSLSLSVGPSLSLSLSRVSCLLRRAVLAQFGATLARAITAEKRAGRVLLLCMKCVCVCVSVPCGGSSVVVFLLFPPFADLCVAKEIYLYSRGATDGKWILRASGVPLSWGRRETM